MKDDSKTKKQLVQELTGLRSQNAALEEIDNNKGILYDADAVDACLRLFREKGFQFEGA